MKVLGVGRGRGETDLWRGIRGSRIICRPCRRIGKYRGYLSVSPSYPLSYQSPLAMIEIYPALALVLLQTDRKSKSHVGFLRRSRSIRIPRASFCMITGKSLPSRFILFPRAYWTSAFPDHCGSVSGIHRRE
jgi:hypothetical protein